MTLARAAGLTAQKFVTLYEALRFQSYDELAAAIASGEVAKVKGFSDKSAAKMAAALASFRARGAAMTLDAADELIAAIGAYLGAYLGDAGVGEAGDGIVAVGARRRGEETVDCIELAARTERPSAVLTRFIAYPQAANIIEQRDDGATRNPLALGRERVVARRLCRRTSATPCSNPPAPPHTSRPCASGSPPPTARSRSRSPVSNSSTLPQACALIPAELRHNPRSLRRARATTATRGSLSWSRSKTWRA